MTIMYMPTIMCDNFLIIFLFLANVQHKKGVVLGSENCHFCAKRVYVVERMSAEGKFFHRSCFRCNYCNILLR